MCSAADQGVERNCTERSGYVVLYISLTGSGNSVR